MSDQIAAYLTRDCLNDKAPDFCYKVGAIINSATAYPFIPSLAPIDAIGVYVLGFKINDEFVHGYPGTATTTRVGKKKALDDLSYRKRFKDHDRHFDQLIILAAYALGIRLTRADLRAFKAELYVKFIALPPEHGLEDILQFLNIVERVAGTLNGRHAPLYGTGFGEGVKEIHKCGISGVTFVNQIMHLSPTLTRLFEGKTCESLSQAPAGLSDRVLFDDSLPKLNTSFEHSVEIQMQSDYGSDYSQVSQCAMPLIQVA